MFCPNCGTQIKEGTRFCPDCGAPLTGTAPGQGGRQPQYQQPADRGPVYQQPQYQQPINRTQQRSSAQIILGLLGAVLLIGSVLFLPYLSAMGQDETMINLLPDLLIDDVPDPYLFLGLSGLGAIFAIANVGLGLLLPGLAAVGLWVYELIKFLDRGVEELLSIGFYGILVGAILLVVGGIVTMAGKHKA